MSARRLHTLISVIVLLALLIQPLGAGAAIRTPAEPVAPAHPFDPEHPGYLFRTSVTLEGSRNLARLEKTGVQVLDPFAADGVQTARVLVDGEQLADLARLGFQPQATDELRLLVDAQGPEKQWLAEGLQPLLAQADAVVDQQATAAVASAAAAPDAVALQALRTAIQALTPEQLAGVAGSASVDDDADGLTNTQEAWWCTDPLNPDTDADGRGDGAEIQALKDWMGNKRAGPPGETPWPSWPFNSTTCPDKDHDSIPNLAERWELGLNMDLESSDRDRYDDGQELFGTTYCPGSGNACGYGQLPSANHDGILLFPQMPAWVTGSGKHPLVAAYPKLDFAIVKDGDGFEFKVRTATVVTTDQRHEEGETKSYSTTKTEGTSTSDAETETWENWQEYSKTTEAASQMVVAQNVVPQDTVINSTEQRLQVTNVRMKNVTNNTMKVKINNTYESGGSSLGSELSAPVTSFVVDEACAELGCRKYIGSGIKASVRTFADVVAGTIFGTSDRIQDEFQANKCDPTSFDPNEIWCRVKSAGTLWKKNYDERLTAATTAEQQANGLLGGNYLQTGPSSLDISRIYPITFPEPRFIPTETNTTGSSTGGARTTTHTTYEEHAVTEGTAKQFGQSWGTATAQNSIHAADLWFAYSISNTGNDYARVICDLAINVFIGDRNAPVATYYPGNDLGGDGCYSNFQPGESHKYSFATQSRIALTLDQLAAIDQGAAVRLVIEDYSLGQDDFYADDAVGADVQLAIEDGAADGDEAIDNYLIPTWGDETVLDVLARYFPHTTDENGLMIAVWTPEYRADTPTWCDEPQAMGTGSQRTLWCKHALSTADWWNVYTNGMGDGSEGFQDTPAAPGATALFRFNQDSDLDGYSDRSEEKLGTDPNDPASHPKPDLLAGVRTTCTDGAEQRLCTATLSLLNTGPYDAYGVEAVMIAPNDSIAITNNTVGGSGRVRAQKQVIVGSRIAPQTPLPAAWLATGHAKPASGGYYTGPTDRTYTFTAADSGSVGAGTLRLNWNDGASGSGTLNFGAGYLSPTLLDVSHGVKLGLLSGTLAPGESFTVAANTPRDTFQYTVAAGHESDFTPPIVLVSYNDPQGNHRLAIPPAAMNLASPTDNLVTFSGQMLPEPSVEIVTTAAAVAGANTTDLVVNNPNGTTLTNAHLFMEFVNITGTVTSEVPATTNLPPGPNVVPVDWSTASFSPAYDPAQDYIVMAFLTDYQGNILDTAARPLSSFADDPDPAFAMSSADETWDFGTAAQGTLLKRSFTFANTGSLDLLTYVSAPAELTVSQTGSRSVGSTDMTAYEMALNTANLAVGAYDGTITIRTSDPDARERTVHVVGTVTTAPAETPVGAMQRPLDWPAPVSGTQGQWVDFAHTLGPQSETLHPLKVYGQDGVLKGLGKYATSFGAGTASYDMFGDGRDGVMPSNSNLDNNNGTGVGVINSGTKDTYAVSVTDAWGVWRVQPGDAVLIHQTQGTNAGCWEINRAISDFGGGTATYQLAKPLKCNYASGGNNHAQIQRVPQYTACSVSGTMTPLSGWNGSWGGIFAVMCSGTMTVIGSISADGTGYLGGSMISPPAGPGEVPGHQGEGIANGRNARSTGSNVNGGGGGREPDNNGGAGGGHATAGASGHGGISSGGTVVGESTMSSAILFGGAGGSGSPGNNGGEYGGYGGNGGGIVWIGANTIVVDGAITTRGASGQGGRYNDREVYGGGGGAGGSIKIQTAIATLGSNRLQANGGSGGSSGRSGGAGGTGRIRIEYCDTLSGSTNPPTSTQKLNCYIADQATDPTHGLLKLPESGAHTYQVQYGRKLNWSGAASQETKLRVPAGIFTSVTLQALVSDLTSNASFALEVGDPYAACWSPTVVSNNSENTSSNLAACFNAYWASHGAPTTGYLDVPVRVSLDRAGQVLLTNLQVTPTGSKTRYLRLPVQPQGYSSIAASFTVSGGTGPLAIGVDVGGDGSVDWTTTGSPSYPANLTTGNLAAAVNAYLAGKSGEVDVPLRLYLSPFATLNLTGFSAMPVGLVDASISASDVAFSNPTPMETDEITVNATIHNFGSLDTGPLTASFFATPSGGTPWYIGSAFVANVSAPGTVTVPLQWNTLGFTGAVPVRVVVDPYNRLGESNETNNQASKSVTIKTRPDLHVTAITLSDDEPVVGQVVTATLALRNDGQTSAGAFTVDLWDGNPASGGTLVQTLNVAALAGGATSNLLATWTPAATGEHRLFAEVDPGRAIKEYDEGNNESWHDVYVGLAGPILIDSGGGDAYDPAYAAANGFGYLDGEPNTFCGAEPDKTQRSDYDGKVQYRFDHLLPGHFYHLDVTLFECDGTGRQETIAVDDNVIEAAVDLTDSAVHRLSYLLDPALYADRSILVGIAEINGNDVVVSEVNLYDVDYRYSDAGGGNDPGYTIATGYGWLDGVAQTTWGTLPYQSRRTDTSDSNPADDPDNELRYRYDRLDPAKRYQLHATVYQGAGTATVAQSIAVDEVDTGTTITVVGVQRKDVTLDIPPGTYASDRSILVKIIRTNASANAFVNIIALEELTLGQGGTATQNLILHATSPNWISANIKPPVRPALYCSGVTATSAFTTLAGDALLAGAAAPVNSLVEAFTPAGVKAGCYKVTAVGKYGYMRVYGAEGATPGMAAGEPIQLKINGIAAQPTPYPVIWQNDKLTRAVNLAAPDVVPVETFLDAIQSQVARLQSETGTYLPPPADPRFNTTTTVAPGWGYLLYTKANATLPVSGDRVRADTPLALHIGWNWLGYLPTCELPVATALIGIAGQYDLLNGEAGAYRPPPADPAFNNFSTMAPGKGYMIHMPQAATLTYPATGCGAAAVTDSAATPEPPACPAIATGVFTHYYGAVPAGNQPAMAGVMILAYSPRGEVVGCGQVKEGGLIPYLRVYGADGDLPGMQPGEPVSFRLDGQSLQGVRAPIWTGDYAVQRLDLAAGQDHIYLPMIAR